MGEADFEANVMKEKKARIGLRQPFHSFQQTGID